jgi:hypothetical protein
MATPDKRLKDTGWNRRIVVLAACLAGACASRTPVHPELSAAAAEQDGALAVSDALEALIANGTDTAADRDYAYRTVSAHAADTAADAYARAAVTGRLVQEKGLRASLQVADIERFARRSRELDPNFRNGAATRLLGTLYVIAPATLLKHGDSETGLELLEGLVEQHPHDLENHLRLAEAYVALGDPSPAVPHLCLCLANKSVLRRDDQALLSMLIAGAGRLPCAPPAGVSP